VHKATLQSHFIHPHESFLHIAFLIIPDI